MHSLLKFDGLLTNEDLAEIEDSGVRLLSYLGNGAYIAAVSVSSFAGIGPNGRAPRIRG